MEARRGADASGGVREDGGLATRLPFWGMLFLNCTPKYGETQGTRNSKNLKKTLITHELDFWGSLAVILSDNEIVFNVVVTERVVTIFAPTASHLLFHDLAPSYLFTR